MKHSLLDSSRAIRADENVLSTMNVNTEEAPSLTQISDRISACLFTNILISDWALSPSFGL